MISENVIKILEEPMGDPGGIYLYLINGYAKNFGNIILSGEGGDELFGAQRVYRQGEARGWFS